MSEKVVLFCRVSKELKQAVEIEAKNQSRSASSLVENIVRKEILRSNYEKKEILENIERLAGHVS
tara:strand:- start:7706 stop:7900 length:195 start_codon:yes stop_codon:yes gene_type:complete